MRPQVFVDTSAWVALVIANDIHHEETKKIFPELLKGRLLTTNLVVAETYIILRRAAGLEPALEFLQTMETSPRIQRIYSDEELERRAVEILQRYKDHDLSYVDAVSFALMQREKIKEAFAFDRHFQTLGFRLIPGQA